MIPPGKKPRGDSVLKTLPPDLQKAIFERCRVENYEAVRAWLRKDKKITTSTGALSKFFAWYPFQSRIEQVPLFAEQLRDELKKLGTLDATATQLSELTLVAFEMQAMQDRNSELFIELRKLRLKTREQTLAENRFLETKKTDIEKGLDAIEHELKGNSEALALFAKMKAAMLRCVEGKAA